MSFIILSSPASRSSLCRVITLPQALSGYLCRVTAFSKRLTGTTLRRTSPAKPAEPYYCGTKRHVAQATPECVQSEEQQPAAQTEPRTLAVSHMPALRRPCRPATLRWIHNSKCKQSRYREYPCVKDVPNRTFRREPLESPKWVDKGGL